MPLSFDAALGIHPKTLQLRTQRAEVLAHNIANADTPGYKAKDIDFAAFLESHQTDTTDMKRTHATHQRALLMNSLVPISAIEFHLIHLWMETL